MQYLTYSQIFNFTCSGKNLWHLLSFKCFNLYGEVSKYYKLVSILFSDPLLCQISISTDSYEVKFARHNFKVLYHHY
jgi:hypothetical protein